MDSGRNVGRNAFLTNRVRRSLEKIRKSQKFTRNNLDQEGRQFLRSPSTLLPLLDNKLTTFQLHSHRKFVLWDRGPISNLLCPASAYTRGSSRCRSRNGVADNAGAHAISNYWGPFNVRTSDTVTVYPSPTHVSTRILSCTHTQQNPFELAVQLDWKSCDLRRISHFSLPFPFFHEGKSATDLTFVL